jgi:hypothetical protein
MQAVDVQWLIDERKIHGVLARHCIADDRNDAPRLKDCFWADAIEDHGVLPAGNAHRFIDMAQGNSLKQKLLLNRHTLGQVSIDIDGSRARVESYVISYHRVENDPQVVELLFGKSYASLHKDTQCQAHDFIVGGRYLDVLEKRGDEWRILSRVATAEWEISAPMSKVMSEGLFKAAPGPESVHLG